MRRNLKIIFLIVALMFFCMTLTGCDKEEETVFQEVSEEELDEKGTSGEEEETGAVFIHVCGAVNNPGVYELKEGSRVYEAVEAAGGMMRSAAADFINQAEVLEDGQKLYIPSKEELESQNEKTKAVTDGKININNASKEELMTLSGIGEAKADAIIRYREECGGFKSIEDIMEIEGIKEGVFRKIEEQITVS